MYNNHNNSDRNSGIIPNSVLFNRKSAGGNTPRCPLSGKNAPEVNYKNIALFTQFTSDKGKILARRLTGVCAKKQRALKEAIKIARELALMPYSAN